jgi:hypothetical protein
MLGKRHMLRNVSSAIVIAAALAIVAAPSAGAARAHSQACQDGGSWTSVTDDQGISSLVQVGGGSCVAAVACADGVATSSQYSGWVTVTDDNGLAWLYPTQLRGAASRPECATASAVPSVVAAETPAAPILASPYPGWVIVTDDNGIPNLEPIALLGS